MQEQAWGDAEAGVGPGEWRGHQGKGLRIFVIAGPGLREEAEAPDRDMYVFLVQIREAMNG